MTFTTFCIFGDPRCNRGRHRICIPWRAISQWYMSTRYTHTRFILCLSKPFVQTINTSSLLTFGLENDDTWLWKGQVSLECSWVVKIKSLFNLGMNTNNSTRMNYNPLMIFATAQRVLFIATFSFLDDIQKWKNTRLNQLRGVLENGRRVLGINQGEARKQQQKKKTITEFRESNELRRKKHSRHTIHTVNTVCTMTTCALTLMRLSLCSLCVGSISGQRERERERTRARVCVELWSEGAKPSFSIVGS